MSRPVRCAIYTRKSSDGVLSRLSETLADPVSLAAAAGMVLTPARMVALPAKAALLAEAIRRKDRTVITALVAMVRVGSAAVEIDCDAAVTAEHLGLDLAAQASATLTITAEVTLTRTGRKLKLVQDSGAAAAATPDRALVRLLVQSRGWWAVLRTGKINTSDLAAREGVTPSYLARVMRLVFLSPEVTQAILAGRQRAGVTAASLTLHGEVPADWQVQKATLLPARF